MGWGGAERGPAVASPRAPVREPGRPGQGRSEDKQAGVHPRVLTVLPSPPLLTTQPCEPLNSQNPTTWEPHQAVPSGTLEPQDSPDAPSPGRTAWKSTGLGVPRPGAQSRIRHYGATLPHPGHGFSLV